MSKSVYVAIGLLLGMLAGLAIGVGISQKPAPAVSGTNDAEPPEDTKPDNTRPLEEHAPDKPAPAKTGDGLADIIAGTKVLPLPEGDGTISGHVLTKDGAPLPGVKITATPTYPETRNWGGLDTEARIREQIRYERWRELARRHATTGQDGAFQLERLGTDTTYGIEAELDGWSINRVKRGSRFKTGEVADFTAERAFTIPVEVRMPDGSFPPYGRVSYDRENGSSAGTLLDDGKGELRLSPGAWKIRASYGNWMEYQGEEITLTLTPDSKVEPLILQLKARPGVKGTITVPEIYSNPSLRVYVVKDPPAEAPDDANDIQRHNAGESWVRSMNVEDGPYEYAVIGLEPGRYRVLLLSSNEIADWKDVVVAGGIVETDLAVKGPERGDYIVVKALDPDGNLLPDLDIDLELHSEHVTMGGRGRTVKPGDGTVWVPRTRPDSRSGSEITDWWYELTVSSKEYGALTRRVERDDQSDQEFRFQAAATLTLNVPGFDEHELRESLNWVVYGVDENGNTLSTINRGPHKGDGNKSPLKFGPFQPGRCRLELFYGSGHSSISLVREEVTLASGENVLTRNIPRLYALKVKCPNADDAPRLKLKRDGHTRYAGSGDNSIQDNTVEFPYLIAGDYVLETRQGRMKVTVPAPGTVEFAPPPFDCIVMSSIKEGGIVEGLGLRNGDRLIAKIGRAHV